jgi:hypothetical protein
MTLAIGVLGAAILLIFFTLGQFGKLKTDSLWYGVGNFIGALLLTYYAYAIQSWPFVVIESIWALVSLKDVLHDLKR